MFYSANSAAAAAAVQGYVEHTWKWNTPPSPAVAEEDFTGNDPVLFSLSTSFLLIAVHGGLMKEGINRDHPTSKAALPL